MNRSQSPVKEVGGADRKLDVTDGRRTISVHSSGEVTSLPDVIKFTLSVHSSKEILEDAQASVKRRTDYIAQVARKTGVKTTGVTLCTEVGKESGRESEQGDLTTVSTDAVIECDTFQKCEAIRNVLVEKLDSSVQFSPVTFWHSTEAKEVGRY